MTLLFLLACQSAPNVDQECFLDYLSTSRATTDVYYTCRDDAASGEDEAACADDLGTGSAADRSALGACAGEGCVADWIGCIEAENNISCYDTLETCGGWINTGLVDDCNSDANACGDSAGCADDYYDCLIYAAGG